MKPPRRIAGAADTERSTEPFFFPGGRVGCLLIHGFTSSPYEMRYLGQRLHDGGCTVKAVRLAGHGTSVEDLEESTRQQWLESVVSGLDELLKHVDSVVVVGLSLGSLLALKLAHIRPDAVAALALLSPALVLQSWWGPQALSWGRGVLGWLPKNMRFLPKPGSDIADEEARRVHPGYRSFPLRGVTELLDLQSEVRVLLPEIAAPTIAVHARQDHTVDIESLALLQRHLPALWASVILPQSFHVVTVDLEKERVAQEILRFIEQAVKAPRFSGRGARALRRSDKDRRG